MLYSSKTLANLRYNSAFFGSSVTSKISRTKSSIEPAFLPEESGPFGSVIELMLVDK